MALHNQVSKKQELETYELSLVFSLFSKLFLSDLGPKNHRERN